MKRILEWALPVLILIALVFIALDFYQRFEAYNQQIAMDAATQAQDQQNSNETLQALEAAGVTSQQISQGFWYITTDQYGNQSVAYFDLNQWSDQSGLTEAEIEALAQQVASSSVLNKGSIQAVPANELPSDLQFHNELYSGNLQPGQFAETQGTLEIAYRNGAATADQLWELSYMYELQGDYADRNAVDAADCTQYRQRCDGTIPVVLNGAVYDEAGNPVQGASVTVLDDTSVAPVLTNDMGEYTIKLSALPLEKLRVSAVKRNYTNGVASAIILNANTTDYTLDPIQLASPILIVTLDTRKHTVSDPSDTANADGSFVLTDGTSTYDIPAGAIVHDSGTPYEGQLDAYIYEFTRETVPASLVTLDTFDQVKGYAGNLMQSYGMPYIQFFAPSGEELDVVSSNPMLLTFNIPSMPILESPQDPYGAVTSSELQQLVQASQADPGGFPITSAYLLQHAFVNFPPFWVLDRLKGVWQNDGFRLLNASGTIQMPFYTISAASNSSTSQ